MYIPDLWVIFIEAYLMWLAGNDGNWYLCKCGRFCFAAVLRGKGAGALLRPKMDKCFGQSHN